jgi:response regulator RpfG family c-di-GMP phosphodiesterase
MRFSDIGISVRVAAGYAVLMLLMAAIAWAGVSRIYTIRAETDMLLKRDWKALEAANIIDSQSREAARRITNLIIQSERAARVSSYAAIDAAKASIDAALADLMGIDHTSRAKQLLAELRATRDIYFASFVEVADLVEGNDRTGAEEKMATMAQPALEAMLINVDALNRLKRQEVQAASERARADMNVSLRQMGIFGVIALMVSCLFAVSARLITRPLGEAIKVAVRVAEGDLTPVTRSTARDETGQLLKALGEMTDSLARNKSEIEVRIREIAALQDVTIHTMASLAETRDNETGNHIRRTSLYVKVLAEKLQSHPRFQDFLTPKNIELLYKSAPLHDIGKVGIPDRILLKPGRFDTHEMEIMKTHTTLGRDAIVAAEKELGVTVDFLTFAKEIAYGHQEKWDGSGYPEGLAGDRIPISARLMAVADVYDALISKRVYKAGMPHEKAIEIIIEGRGSHFDPDIVDAFLQVQDLVLDIAHRFADTDDELDIKREKLQAFSA